RMGNRACRRRVAGGAEDAPEGVVGVAPGEGAVEGGAAGEGGSSVRADAVLPPHLRPGKLGASNESRVAGTERLPGWGPTEGRVERGTGRTRGRRRGPRHRTTRTARALTCGGRQHPRAGGLVRGVGAEGGGAGVGA